MKDKIIKQVKEHYNKMIETKEDQMIGIFVYMANHYIHIAYCIYIDNVPYIRVMEYKYTGLTGWYSIEQFEDMINSLDEIIRIEYLRH